MPGDTVAAARDSIAAAAPVTVIGALDLEIACLGTARAPEPARLKAALSGPGAARAHAAAARAIADGACGLVSWGLAGGLAPGLGPGTVLVPQRIVAAGRPTVAVSARWHAAVVAALAGAFPVHCGDLGSVDDVLRTPSVKGRVAADLGVAAADMESHAIVAAATAARVPAVVVRVVADAAEDRLPDDVEKWIAADGRRRFMPVFSTLAAPGQWPSLLRLAARYRKASRQLRAVAAALEPSAFAFPAGAAGPEP